MGRVTTPAILENASELFFAQSGRIPASDVHRVEIAAALVDTGAVHLSAPKSILERLGFNQPFATRKAQTTPGVVECGLYGPVRLTVMDRIYQGDVVEIAEGCPVLIGQIPLEALDLVVDPKNQRLIGNPEHDGQHLIELY